MFFFKKKPKPISDVSYLCDRLKRWISSCTDLKIDLDRDGHRLLGVEATNQLVALMVVKIKEMQKLIADLKDREQQRLLHRDSILLNQRALQLTLQVESVIKDAQLELSKGLE